MSDDWMTQPGPTSGDPTPWAVGDFTESTALASVTPQVRGGIVRLVTWTACGSFVVALLVALWVWRNGLLVTTKPTSS
jgi:hypothetical protein